MIIDLSENNGIIDYDKVKSAGVTAVILKVCPGIGKIDSYLIKNATELFKRGIAISYYHVIHADNRAGTIEADALSESNYFLNAIKNLPKPIRLWADIEDWDNKGTDGKLSPIEFQTWLKIYLDNIKEKTGSDAGIYTYKSYFDLKLPKNHIFANFKLWIAAYVNKPTPDLPNGFTTYHLWQYSSEGRIAGIKTNVDLSRMNQINN